MIDSNSNLKSVTDKLLSYSCPDLDCPYESKEYRCCQYCFHIPDSDIKNPAHEWKCNLANREAQRRHHAELDEKQARFI